MTYQVHAIDLADWMERNIPRDPKPFLSAKFDVEGAEYVLMRDLMLRGQACRSASLAAQRARTPQSPPGGVGERRGGWGWGEAAVALETRGDLSRQPPLLGAVVRLLNLRGVAEQQQRQSGQLPPAPNRPPQKIATASSTCACTRPPLLYAQKRNMKEKSGRPNRWRELA